jgi:hypothetical protein
MEQLSSDAGAQLLRALGVKGDEAEMRIASDEFSGHCLALTLLGSYLTMLTMGIFVAAKKCLSILLSRQPRKPNTLNFNLKNIRARPTAQGRLSID